MTFIYIIAIVIVSAFSLRSIVKSLKKSEVSYEYTKEEMKANRILGYNTFDYRK